MEIYVLFCYLFDQVPYIFLYNLQTFSPVALHSLLFNFVDHFSVEICISLKIDRKLKCKKWRYKYLYKNVYTFWHWYSSYCFTLMVLKALALNKKQTKGTRHSKRNYNNNVFWFLVATGITWLMDISLQPLTLIITKLSSPSVIYLIYYIILVHSFPSLVVDILILLWNISHKLQLLKMHEI